MELVFDILKESACGHGVLLYIVMKSMICF